MKKFFIAVALLLAMSITSVAGAAGPFGPVGSYDSLGYGWAYGGIYGYQSTLARRLPTPPYFSIYAPVYYGERFARPYGDSPFAAIPGVYHSPAFELQPLESVVVHNPHCPPSAPAEAAPTTVQSASQLPLTRSRVIENPFVTDEGRLASR